MALRTWSAVLSFALAAISSAQSTQVLNIVKDYRANRTSFWRASGQPYDTTRLQVNYTTLSTYPSITVNRPAPSDWRDFDAFVIEVTNPNPFPVQFYLRMDDSTSANGLLNCRTGWAYIEANHRRSYAFPLRLDPSVYGMKGMPGLEGATWLSMNNSVVDISHVIRYLVYLANPAQPMNLVLGSPRLIRSAGNFNNLVDPYGQYTGAEWPGKIHSLSELIASDVAEQQDLAANPSIPGTDAYGGWSAGTNLTSTGRFRTLRQGNNWWLVDPDGWPYLSFGMNATGEGDPTIVTGREYMFTWLPDQNDPLARYYGRIWEVNPSAPQDGVTYKFRDANLDRKFGANWLQANNDRAVARLKSWGFNTLGNWSLDGLRSRRQVPYTVGAELDDLHTQYVVDPKRVAMSDPFDPAFRTSVQVALENQAAEYRGDPWCVGWFIDNEPNFVGGNEENGRYGVAYAVLRASVFNSPAKIVFLSDLQDKYQDIANLNFAWGTNFANWGVMAFPLNLTDADGPAARKVDFQNFCLKYAREYFKVMDEELHRIDDKALFLGSRFFRHTVEVRQAAAEYCDVLSFNVYAQELNTNWINYGTLNKPFMISEFHFGALDRGMFHPGLEAVLSQAERANSFRRYVRSVIDHPLFIGCHWMQYMDQPLTGRVINGENYNIGFVTGTDQPYPELVGAAREVFNEAYLRRWQRN